MGSPSKWKEKKTPWGINKRKIFSGKKKKKILNLPLLNEEKWWVNFGAGERNRG